MKRIITTIVFIALGINYINAQAWVWIKQFSGTGICTPVDIVYGSDNNVYITGLYTQQLTIGPTTLPYSGPDPREDIFLCSFTWDGTFRWARQIGGNHLDDVGGIALDSDHNIYIVGSYRSTTLAFPPSAITLSNVNHYDAFLAKYDNNGNLIFANRTFWGTDPQRIKDVVVDFTNNRLVMVGFFKTQLIYFDGAANQTITTPDLKEHFIALYNLNGDFINIKTIKGSLEPSVFKTVNNCVFGGSVQGYFLTGDLNGKLYLPGGDTLKGDEVNMDAMVVRYDANLNYLWSRRGGGTSWEHVNSAARDDNGNIYIAGKCQSDPVSFDSTKTLDSKPLQNFGFFDYYLAKYNRNGYLQWIRRKGGPGEDNAYGLAVKNSRVVTAGNISNGGNIETGFDLYDINGKFIYGDVITGSGEDQGTGVAFNQSADSIYITGWFKSDILHFGSNQLTNTVTGVADGFLAKYGYDFRLYLIEKKDISCNGTADGCIKVGTQFGNEPVSFVWIPDVSEVSTGNTSEACGLNAGSYKIIATDNLGAKDSIAIQIVQPAVLTINTDLLKNVSCYGGEDGEIRVTVSGGTTPRILTWSGPDNLIQNNTIQTGLLAGTYKMAVVDASGCTAEKIFNVSEAAKIAFGGSTVSGITVPPTCNGAVNLSLAGGTPGYTYDWSGPMGYSSTSGTINGLCNGGNYELEVTDSKSCIQDTTFYMPVDTGLNIMICNKNNVSCKGDCNGSLKVCVLSGGSGTYSYAWRNSMNDPVGGNDPELTNVCTGTYYVKVTDLVNGKVRETSAEVEEPAIPLTLSSTVTDISCYGKSDGFIDLMPIGGWGGYTYLWLPRGDTTQDVSNLTSGDWTVIVTDAMGCIKLPMEHINEPTEILVNEISIYDTISCHSDSDGSLWAHVSGGSKPYSYFWNDAGSQNDSIAIDLPSGTYTVNVIDHKGCRAQPASGPLTEPDELVPAYLKTDVKCKGVSDGTITMDPTGGTKPYSYVWDDGPVTKDRTGLTPGQYCVTVTDYHGCTAYVCIDISEPITSVSINSTVIDSVKCFNGADGRISVSASGGTGIHTYTITPGGTSNTTGIFDNLPVGEYCVKVEDANLCFVDTCLLEVKQPDQITINGLTDSVNCNGGSDGTIITDIKGGTLPYACLWDDGPTTCDRTGLPADTYTLTFTDDHGCTMDTTFTIDQPVSLMIMNVYTSWDTSLQIGQIIYNGSGGIEPYVFKLTGGNDHPNDTISNNVEGNFFDLTGGAYIIMVIDKNNCFVRADSNDYHELGYLSTEQLFTEPGISLYPNPTNGKLTVEVEARDNKDIYLEIVNLMGQVIWKKELQNNGQPRFVEVIDMSQQSKGTYFMRLNGLPVPTKILLE